MKETFQQQNADINPNHPNCVSKCIHDFTWTTENRPNVGKTVGNIQENISPAALQTSNCFKCIRNFYHGAKKIRDNTCN